MDFKSFIVEHFLYIILLMIATIDMGALGGITFFGIWIIDIFSKMLEIPFLKNYGISIDKVANIIRGLILVFSIMLGIDLAPHMLYFIGGGIFLMCFLGVLLAMSGKFMVYVYFIYLIMNLFAIYIVMPAFERDPIFAGISICLLFSIPIYQSIINRRNHHRKNTAIEESISA